MNAIERLGLTSLERRHPEEMDNWALDRVRAMGRRVVDADATVLPPERAPAVGSVWTPTRHMARGTWVPAAGRGFARRVLGCTDGEVRYSNPFGNSGELLCALSTWHVWVRRTRAVAS